LGYPNEIQATQHCAPLRNIAQREGAMLRSVRLKKKRIGAKVLAKGARNVAPQCFVVKRGKLLKIKW
jgi:hypothetical protein